MQWKQSGPLEKILISLYEQSITEIWCHSRAAAQYGEVDTCFSVPRIILSGIISGSALVLEYVKQPDYKSYALIGISAIGAANSLIGTLQVYVSSGKLSGTHRQIAESWAALARDISIVLRKEIPDRPDAEHFLADTQSTFSRLTESSPPVPSNIIKAFKKENREWMQDHEVAMYLNGLHMIDVYRPPDDSPEEVSISLAADRRPLRSTIRDPREDPISKQI